MQDPSFSVCFRGFASQGPNCLQGLPRRTLIPRGSVAQRVISTGEACFAADQS